MAKGIWIQRNKEDVHLPDLLYETFLREITEDLVAFIPFEHECAPLYLGSVGFLDIGLFIKNSGRWQEKLDTYHGLLQNKFYPLGNRTELCGKGLAQRIEFEIAKDISKTFPEETPIVIGACSEHHLRYCERIGLPPFKPISLKEYVRLLSKI